MCRITVRNENDTKQLLSLETENNGLYAAFISLSCYDDVQI